MNLNLQGKCAFITGSAAGIGYSIAQNLLEEGAEVILNGLKQSDVDNAVSSLKEINSDAKVSGAVADFSKPEALDKLGDTLADIDILINNVGVYSSSDFQNTSDEDWSKMTEVNIMSGVRLSRMILPQLLQKGWGRIIFISSECADLVPVDLIAYSATKASIEAVSKGLAQICIGTAVTVNSIMPGSTLTEGAKRFLEEEANSRGTTPQEVADDFFKSTRTSSLVSRFLDPKEIADVVTFLSSPNSSAINGSVVNATGGSVR